MLGKFTMCELEINQSTTSPTEALEEILDACKPKDTVVNIKKTGKAAYSYDGGVYATQKNSEFPMIYCRKIGGYTHYDEKNVQEHLDEIIAEFKDEYEAKGFNLFSKIDREWDREWSKQYDE